MVLKVLNLYAGIGGNRKYWDNCKVTAVEWHPSIAAIYKDFFPDDLVIVEDAHKYLEKHFNEFDFIWSSPPCPTHSRMRKSAMNFRNNVDWKNIKPVFPDMTLYEEVLFLEGYYKGDYCVENVISWYEPLIRPQKIGRHYFWSNINLTDLAVSECSQITFGKVSGHVAATIEEKQKRKGFEISKYSGIDKDKILNNCVEPEIGKVIFDCVLKKKVQKSILI